MPPLPSFTAGRCADRAADILHRELCLTAISKNAEGELKLIHHQEEKCPPLECLTLKTEHVLTLKVVGNKPCDQSGALLNGAFRVTNLAHAFENGDGRRRGIHAGDFRWQGGGGATLAAGTISGITNAGILREPVFKPACEKCNQPGVMEGRFCGVILRARNPKVVGCQVFGMYRFLFDPSPQGGQGGIRGTLEGVIECQCPAPSTHG